MADAGVRIQGLREVTRSMEKAGVDVEDLKDVMGRVATEASETMQRFVPSRSGRLRGSVRGNRAKGKAIVTVGRATVPYAGPILYGWPSRNIKSSNTVPRTDEALDDRLTEILLGGWADIVERNGLG